jgi:hypothetical protein
MTNLDPFDERDIRAVYVWATAVLRRMTDVGVVVRRVVDEGRTVTFGESVTILGDAGQAAVALSASLRAAARYLATHPDVEAPIPTAEFDDLRRRARLARDAVEHMDDKMERDPAQTELRVQATTGVVVVAPTGKYGQDIERSEIAWIEMEDAARKMLKWLHGIGHIAVGG